MRVLVTGASGFVGRAVCRAFGEAGDSVHALLRGSAPGNPIAGVSTTAVAGPIERVDDWRPFLADVDVVIHLAARVHDENAADYDAVNRDAAARLAAASAGRGVKHFVFVSTVKVMGEKNAHDRAFVETDAPRPEGGYAQSKWQAEQILTGIARNSSMPLTILRPPLVYGPCVAANFLRLLRAVERGLPLPLGLVRNRRSILYVENLASAIVRAANGPGGLFFVRDTGDVSSGDLVRMVATALGKRAILVPIPITLLRLAGIATRRSGAVDRLTSSLAVDDAAFRRVMNWQPPFSTAEGLSHTAAWYKSRR